MREVISDASRDTGPSIVLLRASSHLPFYPLAGRDFRFFRTLIAVTARGRAVFGIVAPLSFRSGFDGFVCCADADLCRESLDIRPRFPELTSHSFDELDHACVILDREDGIRMNID